MQILALVLLGDGKQRIPGELLVERSQFRP
jgi:hypothetical protein